MNERFHFCPQCGHALQRMALPWEPEKKELQCSSCHFVFWQNSKPTATAIIENASGDAVLLVQRAAEPFKGMWDLPGGFLEEGEHPEEGLRRELREELNVEITSLSLHGIFMDRYGADGDSTLTLIYRCRLAGGTPQPSDDVADAAWFALQNLPEELAFRSNKEAMNHYLVQKGLVAQYAI